MHTLEIKYMSAQAMLFQTGHGDPQYQTPEEVARPLARREDPDTSKQAATGVALEVGKLQRIVAEVVCKYATQNGPMTATEIGAMCARIYGGLAESYRKRVRECVRLDLISERPERQCSITGKNSATYTAWSCR